MRNLLPLLLLLPVACAGPVRPDPAAWIGSSEAALVTSLGVPDRVYERDGRRVLSYDRAASSAPLVTPSIGFGVGGFSGGGRRGVGIGTGLGLGLGGGLGGGGGLASCTTSYEIRGGQVISAAQTGPDCG
jgi:hypothetical protein